MIIGDGKLRYTIRLCTFKILFLFFYFECFEQTSEENNLLTNVCCFDAIPGTEVSFVVLCFSKNWSKKKLNFSVNALKSVLLEAVSQDLQRDSLGFESFSRVK